MATPLVLDLAVAGVTVGSAAALSGVGLVVCYRATGVLNLAQGAVAMVTAYALRQTVVVWHWPRLAAIAACVLVLAPGLGVLMDVAVFRRLQRRGAGTAETLAAGVAVFVLLVGAAALLWGLSSRGDAPVLVPARLLVAPGGLRLTLDTVVDLGIVLVLTAGVGAVSRWTPFGTTVRAVVDNRRLAELAGMDADEVASVGWAFGAFTAGLTGVLLAPGLRLDPYGLPLLVMETMAVAVAAGLRSLPLAVAAALALGIGQSELTAVHLSGRPEELLQAVSANLFVLALVVVVLIPGRSAAPAETASGLLLPGGRLRAAVPRAVFLGGAAVLLLIPLLLRADDLRQLLPGPALALVLLSIVVVTGYGGQISLGQAGYAGLGALLTGALSGGTVPGVPVLSAPLALALAVLVCAPLGLLVGRPAIRRRGLALALTTFALGTAVSRLVFQQPYLTDGAVLDRTGAWADDRFFYGVELALLGAALLLVRALRRGRTGRALGAMRDHEPAAYACGVRVPRLKLLAFTAGAALAALGGGLLGLGAQAFDPDAFDPVLGLVWFAAVVVFGAGSASGAVLAAVALTAVDAATAPGVSAAVVGVLALLRGRLPAQRGPAPHGPRPTGAAVAAGAGRVRLSPRGRELAGRTGRGPAGRARQHGGLQ
ncbi:ABC transporter permease [Streptacidiphilus sp. PB12-B1b]|uniref:ABC transporter permease subunit n=1 Tax=Streptacidiphilus sp. PB12-B1b TaxID=2705012 RepID=UPI0015FBF603|nr:ABC transporter permease [Streptacidiphilus sp. PB12-B1b]QMU77847.1 ABC transporter permease [Streptacidiphilus sp. PB12-B1b]